MTNQDFIDKIENKYGQYCNVERISILDYISMLNGYQLDDLYKLVVDNFKSNNSPSRDILGELFKNGRFISDSNLKISKNKMDDRELNDIQRLLKDWREKHK